MTLDTQRQATIARLEALGHLDPTCPSCLAEHYPWFREVWNGTTHTVPFAPPHKNREAAPRVAGRIARVTPVGRKGDGMSTTLDARLAALNVGDTVKVDGWRHHCEFVAVRDGQAILYQPPNQSWVDGLVFIVKPDRIVWPDPPKAKPGVVYRHKRSNGIFYPMAVGTVRGGLIPIDQDLDSPLRYLDMSADWIEVPDEQEGR